jgi:hypothetical protein
VPKGISAQSRTYDFQHALKILSIQVSGNVAAPHRRTGQHRFPDLARFDHRGQVIGERVVITGV